MGERLQACSHYCDHKKEALYLPGKHIATTPVNAVQKLKNRINDCLKKTKAGSFMLHTWQNISKLLLLPVIFHGRYCANNSLGIFITTSCNLSCFNCQTSASQAPAADLMSVAQMEQIVNEATELKYYWDEIYLTGGEPTLHPQFFDILDVLKIYKDFNPECEIILETNGAGEKVQLVLQKVPGWLTVHNSSKSMGKQDYEFFNYNVAPIDSLHYRLFSDFSDGCKRACTCYGLCATMYGYYTHTPCMNIDRVFGFDIGIKKLSLVSEQALREQMKILCGYCGWFKEPADKVSKQKLSKSWKKAFLDYKKHKPELTPYK